MRKRPQITTSEAIEPIYISEKRLPCGGALTLGSWNNRLVVADWIDGWHHSTIMNRLQKYTKASVVKSTSKVSKRLPIGSMRISRAAKNLRTLISFSSARISKNAFGSSCWKFHTARRSLTGSSLKKPELQKPLEQSVLPSEIILSPSSFPATASSAKISHSPVTAAVLMSKNICSHTNSAPISKIYLLATAQGALLDRHNKNFRSCNGT